MGGLGPRGDTLNRILLEIKNLERSFPAGEDRVKVLKGLNLTICKGEMVAIMGASGSGKSTLMNILGCLDRPTSGTYKVDGEETASLSRDELATLRRDYFGFIFQSYHLMSHLNAAGNTEIPAVYGGMNKTDRTLRAAALLKRLGLGDKTGHLPGQLSGGQQQRVSIARSLMNGGQVILADEPTGALDSKNGTEVMKILKELHTLGHTIILVSHDPDIAAQAQRIIRIADGKILSDTPARSQSPGTAEGAPEPGKPIQPPGLPRRHLGVRFSLFIEAFKMAWIAMVSHRLRTTLTMLGIIIGIAAVVSVVALGKGARQRIISHVNTIGTNTIDIFPGSGWGDIHSARVETLVPADLEALEAQVYVDSLTPEIKTNKVLRFRNVAVTASVNGVGAAYFRVRGIKIAQGRSFMDRDIASMAQVAVIGWKTRSKLFPRGRDPVGQTVLVGNVPVVIVGVTDPDNPALRGRHLNLWMPYTSVMNRVSGQQFFSSVTVRVKAGMSNDIAQKSIEHLLKTRHGVQDFFTRSSDKILKTVKKTSETMTILISAIAVISLVVGGIGVMNIMLVSVTERTREIGIRMAVGARPGDIMQQFLIEAILVCIIGGILGIFLSFGVEVVFSYFISTVTMQISLLSIVAAFTCSTAIGIFFGFLPARSAARLNPIDALARE